MKNITSLLILVFTLCCCEKDMDSEKTGKCDLTPDPGLCKAYIPKYYFDKGDGKCKEFIWGGCGGVVPFETLQECEECDCSKSLNE